MKIIVIVALLIGSRAVFAEDLSLQDGVVYRNVTIISADPESILIAHDGGGCQVKYADLVPDSLSTLQKKAIADGLKEYAGRKIKLETLELEREDFAAAQREKGLILFEGDWMKPADRQEILASRELDKLEQERARIELEKQKAELRNQQLLNEQEALRLAAESRSRSYRYTGYPVVYAVPGCGCSNPKSCRHAPNGRPVGYIGPLRRDYRNGFSVSISSGGSSAVWRGGGFVGPAAPGPCRDDPRKPH